MFQLSLFDENNIESKITNIASVPNRSPFRYPGGKTWLVPQIRQWLRSLSQKPKTLIEPFVGGGIISLTAVFENLVDRATMVELDEQVAAVWQTIFNGGGEWLADQIVNFDLSVEAVTNLLSQEVTTSPEIALQTIIKNRINHGGIIAPGAGRLKKGEKGKGLKSRWYPETLEKRILDILSQQDKFDFIHGDGLKIIQQNMKSDHVVFFIDPPYTHSGKKAGSRLYRYSQIDHEQLFVLAENLVGDFLMTYHDTEEVRNLAIKSGLQYKNVRMQNNHNQRQQELIIGKNLEWLK
jgi:DNA adenine methylase